MRNRSWLPAAILPALVVWLLSTGTATAQAVADYAANSGYIRTPVGQTYAQVPTTIGQYYYYPYYYFPHSYWPTTGPRWPEAPGEPYMRPPAYMAYPAFHEPHWRYELWNRRSHYRGFHFWLDAF